MSVIIEYGSNKDLLSIWKRSIWIARRIIAGPEVIGVFDTLSFTDFSAVIRKSEQYCTPRVNDVFRKRLQHEGETIEQYVTDLKHKARTCNYGILEESLIPGTLNLKVKEKLLSNDDLGLEKKQ